MDGEKLKVITLGMGYEDVAVEDGLLWAGKGKESYIYAPLTNNDQMVEIIERLKTSISYRLVEKDWLVTAWSKGDKAGMVKGEGQTINEAVCLAAYEYFKGGE